MPSSRQRISTGSPFEKTMGYSRALVQGDWCFVSGVTGYDYDTMTMPETVADQARNCFGQSKLLHGSDNPQDLLRVWPVGNES